MLIARASGMIVASSPGAQNGGASRRFHPPVIWIAPPAWLGVYVKRANLSPGTPPHLNIGGLSLPVQLASQWALGAWPESPRSGKRCGCMGGGGDEWGSLPHIQVPGEAVVVLDI